MKLTSLIALAFFALAPLARADAPAARSPSNAELDDEAAQARQRVIEIVNQPIVHLPRAGQMTIYSPGWFDPGAQKPAFDTVDVRATQQLIYVNGGYVTSDLNPGEMFRGGDLEFNAMTKYFYTDRSLPKARLSEAEMLEINRLYRVIGRDEDAHASRNRIVGGLVLAAVLLAGGLVLVRRYL